MAEIKQNQEVSIGVSGTSSLHLLCAFRAMEPSDVLISFARDMGGGSIKEGVQSFIWEHCINPAEGKEEHHGPYIKRFLKKLIVETESNADDVLDELYEWYAYMTSLKDEEFSKGGNSRVVKRLTFLFPDECSGLSSCPISKKLEISLQCSLNMLEGDTGCSIWPSSLFLSEFILSSPEIFRNKSCFEVGSGVGLVGICLAHVNASSVILSDGDMSTLANMKVNMESNLVNKKAKLLENKNCPSAKCVYLPWESATEIELQKFAPEIVLGADVIYNPSCLPHLVRVMSVLLKGGSAPDHHRNTCQSEDDCLRSDAIRADCSIDGSHVKAGNSTSKKGSVAYIAFVIRNSDTFNYFLHLLEQANLNVIDVTDDIRPYNLLPYLGWATGIVVGTNGSLVCSPQPVPFSLCLDFGNDISATSTTGFDVSVTPGSGVLTSSMLFVVRKLPKLKLT